MGRKKNPELSICPRLRWCGNSDSSAVTLLVGRMVAGRISPVRSPPPVPVNRLCLKLFETFDLLVNLEASMRKTTHWQMCTQQPPAPDVCTHSVTDSGPRSPVLLQMKACRSQTLRCTGSGALEQNQAQPFKIGLNMYSDLYDLRLANEVWHMAVAMKCNEPV